MAVNVVETGQHVAPQAKPLAPIAIAIRQNVKDLQATDLVLGLDPLPRQGLVRLPVGG